MISGVDMKDVVLLENCSCLGNVRQSPRIACDLHFAFGIFFECTAFFRLVEYFTRKSLDHSAHCAFQLAKQFDVHVAVCPFPDVKLDLLP